MDKVKFCTLTYFVYITRITIRSCTLSVFRLYALKTIELDERKKTRTKDAVQKEAK